MPTTNTYKIPAGNLDMLKAEVEKINKKIEKLNRKNNAGLTPVSMEVGAAIISARVDEIAGFRREVIHFPVTITGEAATVAGWTFIATLTHMGKAEDGTPMVVVRAVPGATAEGELAKYREQEQKCDQCGWFRYRNETYVLRNEAGEHKVVGSTCLGDFFPNSDPHAAANFASFFSHIGYYAGCCEDEGFGGAGSRDPKYLSINYYLPFVSLVTRTSGWVSGKVAYETGAKSTAMTAWEIMLAHGKESKPENTPSDKDYEAAAPVVAFVNEHYEAKAPVSDFDQNMSIVYKGGVVDYKLKGIVAYGIEFMKKEIAYRANKAGEAAVLAKFPGLNPEDSEFQGTPGQKNAIFMDLTCIDAGGRRPAKFVDNNGNFFKVWCNKLDFQPVTGTVYNLRTSSISHEVDSYNKNAKTTVLAKTRVATEADLHPKAKRAKKAVPATA